VNTQTKLINKQNVAICLYHLLLLFYLIYFFQINDFSNERSSYITYYRKISFSCSSCIFENSKL